jgi:DNA repair exonuclease SbcCD ATPase subunit
MDAVLLSTKDTLEGMFSKLREFEERLQDELRTCAELRNRMEVTPEVQVSESLAARLENVEKMIENCRVEVERQRSNIESAESASTSALQATKDLGEQVTSLGFEVSRVAAESLERQREVSLQCEEAQTRAATELETARSGLKRTIDEVGAEASKALEATRGERLARTRAMSSESERIDSEIEKLRGLVCFNAVRFYLESFSVFLFNECSSSFNRSISRAKTNNKDNNTTFVADTQRLG